MYFTQELHVRQLFFALFYELQHHLCLPPITQKQRESLELLSMTQFYASFHSSPATTILWPEKKNKNQ